MTPARPRAGPEAALLRRTAIRLGLQTGAAVAAIVALLVVVAVLVVLHSQRAAADRLLADAIARCDGDVDDPPAGVWLVLQDGDRRDRTGGMPAGLADGASLDRVARTGVTEVGDRAYGGVPYQVRTERRAGGAVQALLDLRANHAERNRLLAALLASGGLGLLLAGLVGAWLGRRSVQPLASALALQHRFVADASHELRTPLTVLSTRAQLLRRRLRAADGLAADGLAADAGGLAADADGLVADAGRLTAVLEDLLLAADPRTEPPAAEVDLVALATDICAGYQGPPTAPPGPAQNGSRVPAGGPPELAVTAPAGPSPGPAHGSVCVHCLARRKAVTVLGSPAGLRRALSALVDNAVRHARSAVTVEVSLRGGNAVVEVADDGPGLDPAVLSRMFERFGPAAGPATGGQHGLGLALASEVIGRHGGRVTPVRRPGGGAVLRLTLPAGLPRRSQRPRRR